MYYVTPEQVTEVTAASAYPVTRTEAKSHLRVDISDDDTLIDGLIAAATQYVENFTGRALVERTLRADLPYFCDSICLPHRPIIAISSVKYYDTASPSVLQTLSSSVYSLSQGVVRRNYGASWESTYPRADAVQIQYTAGYLSTASPKDVDAPVPRALKQALLLVVGDLYENREGKIVGLMHSDNPTVHMLLQPYRVYT